MSTIQTGQGTALDWDALYTPTELLTALADAAAEHGIYGLTLPDGRLIAVDVVVPHQPEPAQ